MDLGRDARSHLPERHARRIRRRADRIAVQPRTLPAGGGEAIVNATGWSVKDGYETNWLPSMRMIVDLGNLNNSVTVHTTGQSGHAYTHTMMI